MTHYMKLWDDSFQAIKEGWKTVEMRLNDEKRSAIHIDDFIEFTNTTTQEKMLCKVTNIYKYPDFAELYRNHSKLSIGYKDIGCMASDRLLFDLMYEVYRRKLFLGDESEGGSCCHCRQGGKGCPGSPIQGRIRYQDGIGPEPPGNEKGYRKPRGGKAFR